MLVYGHMPTASKDFTGKSYPQLTFSVQTDGSLWQEIHHLMFWEGAHRACQSLFTRCKKNNYNVVK